MKDENVTKLYEAYPVLKNIDEKYKNIITQRALFKTLYTDENLSTYGQNCPGFLFVLKGNIKIKRINEEGEETNLYDIGKGQICHEALSCYLKCEPLRILGTATQDSDICIVPMEVVNKPLLSEAEFLQYIYIDLHGKINKIINNKEEVKHEGVEKRLIKLLLSKKTKIIYTTHNELAFELDSAREVISRKLKELENSGYLKGSRGKIQIIKDLNELL